MPNDRDRNSVMSSRRHELLQHVVDVVRFELGKLNMDETGADLIANAVADSLADNWGGQLINFPTNFRWRLSQREADIYNSYRDGKDIGSIARQVGMHERSVRKVIDRIRERILAAAKANNRDLFED